MARSSSNISSEYSASIAGGDFLFTETKAVAELFLKGTNEEEVSREVLEKHLFQSNKSASTKRRLTEIKKRLKNLNFTEKQFLVTAPFEVARLFNYLAILRTERLLREFTDEFLVKKHILQESVISESEIASFFSEKRMQDDFMASWSDNTFEKVRQVIIKMVKQAGFLKGKKKYTLESIVVPREFENYLRNNGFNEYLKYFFILS